MRFAGRLSLRSRVTAAASAAVLLACTVLGAGGVVLAGHELRASLDSSLRQRAGEIARLSVSAPALLTSPGALEAPAGGRQLAVEVLDRHRRIVARSLSLGGRLLPADTLVSGALRSGRTGYRSVRLDRDPTRLFVAPVADAGGPASGGAIIVAASTADIDRTIGRLRHLGLVIALIATALGALAAWLLAGRGLRPVRELSAAAAGIGTSGEVSGRLPVPGSSDEVGDLASTLNAMLAALEAARARERRFLADASHELRTPLTSLAGNVEHLARHGADPELIADLGDDTARLRALIDDLLALEREDGGPAPAAGADVRLDALAAELASARVQVDAPIALPVRGEPDALRRALANLVENAVIHGPADSPVTLRAERSDGWAEITVEDEGPGLDDDAAAHAFERFWRDPRALSRPGSGLGLAIVASTAARHGGEAVVRERRVVLRLPLRV